jgi:HSP20 family protein
MNAHNTYGPTRKWSFPAVPHNVIEKEMKFNRENLLTSFDKLFDDAFRGNFPDVYKSFGIDPFSKTSYPKVNVVSFGDKIEIEAEIAGYTRDDISVQIEDNILSIVGKTTATDANKVYILRELKRSSFSRSFKLGDELDAEKIDATFKDGLLKLVIPRKEQSSQSKVNTVTIK